MHCGQLLSFNTKTQIIQVWVNEIEEQEHMGFRTDRMQITRVVYPPGWQDSSFFFIRWHFHTYLILSWLWLPLTTLSISISHHFQPALLLRVCVGCVCVCVCIYAHIAGGGGSYIRFGRGSTICLTCWGRRLEGETQNVFSITLSSHSCSNWFFQTYTSERLDCR